MCTLPRYTSYDYKARIKKYKIRVIIGDAWDALLIKLHEYLLRTDINNNNILSVFSSADIDEFIRLGRVLVPRIAHDPAAIRANRTTGFGGHR